MPDFIEVPSHTTFVNKPLKTKCIQPKEPFAERTGRKMGVCQSRTNEDLAQEIIELQKKALARDYPDPKDTLRDAHPKTVALFRGEFTPRPDLTDDLKLGFLARSPVYPCWVRFSNSNPKPQSDLIADARGCAIKLLDTDGETPVGQDFVLMNTPNMPLGTPQLFRDLIYYAQFSFFLLVVKLFCQCQLFKFLGFLNLRKKTDSIFGESFHSTTPYAFGEQRVVKYALIPTNFKGGAAVSEKGYNYLTDEMQKYLEANGSISFKFCVQFRTDPKRMPIDDAAVLWEESRSPFVDVGTLKIEAQSFTTNERFEIAEKLAFDLGRTLPEHVPLGSLNIVRHMVYENLARYRHERAGRLV